MKRVSELEKCTQKHKSLMDNLLMNIRQGDISVLGVTNESADDEAKACPADGDEASDTGPLSCSAIQPDAQRLRLTLQAMVTVEMLQRVYERDFMLQKMEEKLGMVNTMKSDDELSRKKLVESLKEVENDTWLIRQDNALDMVAKKVVEDFGMEKQASTILSWYREFLHLDGRFGRD